MAGNFLSNARNRGGPSRQAAAAFGSFVFWAVVATVFPYELLIPYWPPALTWGPILLYVLALFNLVRAARHFSLSLRGQGGRPGTTAARWSRRLQKPVAAAGPAPTSHGGERVAERAADRVARTERTARPAANRPAAGLPAGTPSTLPTRKHAPTVQRMR